MWCNYQLFELSSWRHPFTVEDLSVNKWCDAKFLIYNSSTSWGYYLIFFFANFHFVSKNGWLLDACCRSSLSSEHTTPSLMMLPLRWKKLSRILHIDEASCLDISWIAFPKLTLYEINWSCARYLCSKLFFLMHSEAALAVTCWCFSERTLIENLWLLWITLRVRSLDCACVLLRNTTLLDVAAEREWKA